MQQQDYATLTDVYEELKDNDTQKPTDYVLQFYWRDVTYHFDVTGPYFTSCGPVKKDDLIGFLYDTIQLFELNNFHIRAIVCDGASTNLSVIKELMGVKGCFGFGIDELGNRNHKISPSFKHRFQPFKTIHFIICPSHQLKSLIAALYSSRPEGTKCFQYQNVHFGWKAINQVYDEDVARAKKGEARRVKGLEKSFVFRDPWTRLNVRPAKIMQQEDMISALYHVSTPNIGPLPINSDEILMTLTYLSHLKMIFEDGVLCNSRNIRSSDTSVLESILKGYGYFESWLNEILDYRGAPLAIAEMDLKRTKRNK